MSKSLSSKFDVFKEGKITAFYEGEGGRGGRARERERVGETQIRALRMLYTQWVGTNEFGF